MSRKQTKHNRGVTRVVSSRRQIVDGRREAAFLAIDELCRDLLEAEAEMLLEMIAANIAGRLDLLGHDRQQEGEPA